MFTKYVLRLVVLNTLRREFGDRGLIPWHLAVFSVYLAAIGQNALSESCGCFGKAGQATFTWV